jgi:leader peptidase (prepilin peptidase)/N-methyltransferase
MNIALRRVFLLLVCMMLVAIFFLGLIVGSFLNVLVFRHRTGLSLGGRSRCRACGKILRWFELLPVVSFVFQRGKCRGCGARISRQYPAVEIATGVLFALGYWRIASDAGVGFSDFPPIAALTALALFFAEAGLLVAIVAYDLRHRIIPDAFVYPLAGAGLLQATLALAQTGVAGAFPIAARLFAGPALFLPFFLIWLLSRGRAMGFGDAKLALAIGWARGFSAGAAAFALSFWIGAAVSVGALLVERAFAALRPRGALRRAGGGLTMKSEIPFAPFLAAGSLASFLLGIDLGDIGRVVGWLFAI